LLLVKAAAVLRVYRPCLFFFFFFIAYGTERRVTFFDTIATLKKQSYLVAHSLAVTACPKRWAVAYLPLPLLVVQGKHGLVQPLHTILVH
jgi:hypothetical protein